MMSYTADSGTKRKRVTPPARRARVEDGESPRSRPASLRRPQTPGAGTSASSASSPPLEVPLTFWQHDDLLDRATVEGLADIFLRTMYPLRPFIHWPSMMADIRAGRYRSNWGVFIVTIAMCAMAASKLADGGVPGEIPIALQARAGVLATECYTIAVAAVRRDVDAELPIDVLPLLKARSLLGCTCMQRGHRTAALAHYGEYSIISAQAGFHDEANWPSEISEIQRQERRRLFWFAYQADYYTSTTLSLPPRHREARARVNYPADADDDDISDTAVSLRLGHISFMKGWNVCSDLYRMIEHVYDNLRADPDGHDEEDHITAFLAGASNIDSHAALKLLTRLLDDLPPELRRVKPMTGNIELDRLGFIATNIIITAQTLKMMLALSDRSSVHHRCAIASELLDELATLPASYLQASSVTTLQHLAHVGHLLSGVIDGPLPAWTYLQVRNILLVLSEFIRTLEAGRPTPWDLATKLREQIDRIDRNMIQAETATIPGLADSLIRSVGASADNGASVSLLGAGASTSAPPLPDPPAPRPASTSTRILPVPNRMISIEAGLGSHLSPLGPAESISHPVADESLIQDPLAALPVRDLIPPHDALSALQLGSDPTVSSFDALGFAASQGMFESGGASMDDALIGEFLRYWPAHGMLADAVHEGSPYPGAGI
ncbi:unnamed protein product [Cutaneotrichosporon oleaginosum]